MWWLVVGSEGGEYAPAFTNHPYYSSRRVAAVGAAGEGKFYATHEFGFQINVRCPERLKAGDQIDLAIGDSAWSPTYQVGDELVLPIVAGANLRLAGGQDGNTIQKWNVTPSVSAPMAVYVLDTAAPTPYSSGGLTFQINEGGIPFVLGDRFTLAIEGGHYQWRVNEGAWTLLSPPAAIPSSPVLLYQGLSATFTPGNATSFAAGDRYSFRLLQPRAASNIQTPGIEAWQWNGDDPTHVFDFGSAQTFDHLALAMHTIPEGATITFEAGTTAGIYPLSTTLARRSGPMVKQLDAAWTARYMRITVNDAPDAMIGYAYAGNAITTELSADLRLADAWKIDRGGSGSGGLTQSGRYLGEAVNGTLEWTEGALPEADVAKLKAMLRWSKQHDDEPVIIVPNITRPEEAFIGQVAVDEVEFPDISMYQANAGYARRHETRFPVSGVWK